MKTMSRRILKLEARFAPPLPATPDGWAREELLRRLAGVAERLRSAGVVADKEPDLAAVRERIEEWRRSWQERMER